MVNDSAARKDQDRSEPSRFHSLFGVNVSTRLLEQTTYRVEHLAHIKENQAE
jgi:hypothetical protein